MPCFKSAAKTTASAACKRDKGIPHEAVYIVDTSPFSGSDVERGIVRIHSDPSDASPIVANLPCGTRVTSGHLVPYKDQQNKNAEKADAVTKAQRCKWVYIKAPVCGYALRAYSQAALALQRYDQAVVQRACLLKPADEDEWEEVAFCSVGDVSNACSGFAYSPFAAVVRKRCPDDKSEPYPQYASTSDIPLIDRPSIHGREVGKVCTQTLCVTGLVEAEGRLWYRVVFTGYVHYVKAPFGATVKDPFPLKSPIALMTTNPCYYQFYTRQAGDGKRNFANLSLYERVDHDGFLIELEDGEGAIHVLPSRTSEVIMPVPSSTVMYSPYSVVAARDGRRKKWFRVINPIDGYVEEQTYLAKLSENSPILIQVRKYINMLLDWVTLDVLFGNLPHNKLPPGTFMTDLMWIGWERNVPPNLASKLFAINTLISVFTDCTQDSTKSSVPSECKKDIQYSSPHQKKNCDETTSFGSNADQLDEQEGSSDCEKAACSPTKIDAMSIVERLREVHRRLSDVANCLSDVEGAINSLPPHPFQHKKMYYGTELTGLSLLTILSAEKKEQGEKRRQKIKKIDKEENNARKSGQRGAANDTVSEVVDTAAYALDCGNSRIRVALRAGPSLKASVLREVCDGDRVVASHRLSVGDNSGETLEWLRITSPVAGYALFTLQAIARQHVHQAARDRNSLWVPDESPPAFEIIQPQLPETLFPSEECPVCFWCPGDTTPDVKMYTLQCGHQMCSGCCAVLAAQRPQCPICRTVMAPMDVSALLCTNTSPTVADEAFAADDWSLEHARDMVRARWRRNTDGTSVLMLRRADGSEYAAPITSTGNARITVSPGANIFINGQRVQNPEEGCQQQ